MSSRIINADCREAMAAMLADSIDAIVTDPPYHLTTGKKGGTGPASVNLESPYGRARVTTGFMGKQWDGGDIAHDPTLWAEALRVAKPGAHLLAFGGTRTYHRLACAIEDAGWEIRDCVMWVYGSGFPKSLDVSKAIDKVNGAEREIVAIDAARLARLGNQLDGSISTGGQWEHGPRSVNITAPATDAARQWAGWGTALKPAWEPVIVARKPLRGTVAANVMQHGTGALNIDGCRIATDPAVDDRRLGGQGDWTSDKMAKNVYEGGYAGVRVGSSALGRWPANVIHDGSDDVVALFPQTSSGDWNGQETGRGSEHSGDWGKQDRPFYRQGDTGSAARFFYTAKASRADRDDGLHHRQKKALHWSSGDQSPGTFQSPNTDRSASNHHPTVKPVELMRYLCRLVTPPSGTVLDPFCGSGSTGKAALLEGFDFVGIELDPEYAAIASDRIYATAPLFAGAAD